MADGRQQKKGKGDKKGKVDKKGKGDEKRNGDRKAEGAGPERLSKQDYYDRLEPLQVELNRLARWVQHQGRRVLVVIEGRDTAGKGGVISAIADCLNPRQCQVVALPKPSDVERTQWYFQRYVAHLPAGGQITLFDRSWYNRAGVETVMGFCTPEETDAFLKQVPVFERLLVDDGLLLFKYWLTVDQDEQEKRFAERLDDPLKRWKLSPIDLKSRARYREYGEARDRMLEATHTRHAPWTLVDFNDQRRGRLTLIRHLLDQIPDVDVPEQPVVYPPLPSDPQQERFDGPLTPIPSVD
ncbi:MAG TPA: polyphosphate kinase 2 [Quisquiliibacterium sp.]|nr:polyphosphate kinase 2 [Quisquiliibacterium sp.]